jgi:hypothetical protein
MNATWSWRLNRSTKADWIEGGKERDERLAPCWDVRSVWIRVAGRYFAVKREVSLTFLGGVGGVEVDVWKARYARGLAGKTGKEGEGGTYNTTRPASK